MSEDTKIQLVGAEAAGLDETQRDRIVTLVREQLLAGSPIEYHAANAELIRDERGIPSQIAVYLLRRHTYGADVVNIDVDEHLTVLAIHR